MSRKPIDRQLPPLKELFPGFRGFPKNGHRLHLAMESMEIAARRLRKTQNQSFYSMREASKFLAVPISTMALAYQQLEDKGLIVRVRGSRTVLLGKALQTQHPSRSIVSVPIALSSLISSHFTRRFCDRISEELWKHHFVANLILVKELMDTSIGITNRLIKQSDLIIWIFPDRNVKETILTAHDHGIRNIILRAVEDPFLPANYLMDWISIYQRVILEWKKAGIRHVIVAKCPRPGVQNVIVSFLHLLRENDCTYTLAEDNPSDLRDKVEQGFKKKIPLGCAILEHEFGHHLCNSEPIILAKLMTRCRFLFGRGRVYAPYFFKHNAQADVIGYAGDEIAMRVAGDLGRRSGKDESVRLLPQWMPNCNLGEVFI